MKFLRYGNKGKEIPCLIDKAGNIRSLSEHITDFTPENLSLTMISELTKLDITTLPQLPHGERVGACIADAPNIFCIGLNYTCHAAETGAVPPSEPIVFNKATSAIAGPYDTLNLPLNSRHTDWEVELGVVIGKPAYNVCEQNALDYVSAYFTANDISERTYQKHRAGQWVKGKSAPGFAPVGPYLVSADEITDPQNLKLSTIVNGKIMQSSNTSNMIFSLKTIISTLSNYMELRVGDLILTGTPEGVGAGIKPKPRFLRDGDHVEITVEGLGTQRINVREQT